MRWQSIVCCVKESIFLLSNRSRISVCAILLSYRTSVLIEGCYAMTALHCYVYVTFFIFLAYTVIERAIVRYIGDWEIVTIQWDYKRRWRNGWMELYFIFPFKYAVSFSLFLCLFFLCHTSPFFLSPVWMNVLLFSRVWAFLCLWTCLFFRCSHCLTYYNRRIHTFSKNCKCLIQELHLLILDFHMRRICFVVTIILVYDVAHILMLTYKGSMFLRSDFV